MLFGRLLPREGNFFDLFNQHGDQIVAGSRAFMAMVENYADATLRERHAESVDHAEHQADHGGEAEREEHRIGRDIRIPAERLAQHD